MKATDLAVLEEGNHLDITFGIPPQTVEGLPLKEIGGVDLRVGPNPNPNGWNTDEWAASATSVSVPTPQGPGPVLATVPVNQFVGHEVIVAVRVTNPRGRDAGWSEFKTFNVQPPLPDPANFHVAQDPKGVAITWNAAGPSQIRIYRQLIELAKPETGKPQQKPVLLATATETNYTDISAEFGNTYRYSIQAVRDKLESNLVGPETIALTTQFPAPVPTGLNASVGIGSVELAWTRNTEAEFKEYRVLRSEEGGPFTELVRGLEAPVYSDHATQTGKHYRYEVIAVDQNRIPSPPSAPVEITAP
jgi:hypothetical protein